MSILLSLGFEGGEETGRPISPPPPPPKKKPPLVSQIEKCFVVKWGKKWPINSIFEISTKYN